MYRSRPTCTSLSCVSSSVVMGAAGDGLRSSAVVGASEATFTVGRVRGDTTAAGLGFSLALVAFLPADADVDVGAAGASSRSCWALAISTALFCSTTFLKNVIICRPSALPSMPSQRAMDSSSKSTNNASISPARYSLVMSCELGVNVCIFKRG